jgi:hypothetical protein
VFPSSVEDTLVQPNEGYVLRSSTSFGRIREWDSD